MWRRVAGVKAGRWEPCLPTPDLIEDGLHDSCASSSSPSRERRAGVRGTLPCEIGEDEHEEGGDDDDDDCAAQRSAWRNSASDPRCAPAEWPTM